MTAYRQDKLNSQFIITKFLILHAGWQSFRFPTSSMFFILKILLRIMSELMCRTKLIKISVQAYCICVAMQLWQVCGGWPLWAMPPNFTNWPQICLLSGQEMGVHAWIVMVLIDTLSSNCMFIV